MNEAQRPKLTGGTRSLRPWLATVIEVSGLVLLAAGFGLAWLPLGLIVAGGALVFLARGVES